ncbi:hypothetical protein IEQ44_11280 [Nocardioides sp. Y6]|uniref:DUF3995 domain-containing protein n=1 Tax=Nocardioides malaquae TaxID=2773426 RepID=A0ABR9RUF5_9ACTN|nr:hypothetical protein [Nocardioides malaquae]MBE7325237.1 hypothetical protein [Nocardioides malaquae]
MTRFESTQGTRRKGGARRAGFRAGPDADPGQGYDRELEAGHHAHGELDSTPVHRGPVLDERKRPVSVRRNSKLGREVRVDPTRVSGPIRVVLEPMLWLAFLSGLAWVLVALDPGVRDTGEGEVLYEHTLPMAIIVSAILLISTISALMWLPVSTSATRARTAFAGLGMLASGWLFAKLRPVDTQDLLGMSWLSIGIGVLLVAICAVPWPTARALVPRRPTGPERLALGFLLLSALLVGWLAWEAAQVGLVDMDGSDRSGWDQVFPLLGLFVILLGSARFLLRRPDRSERVALIPRAELRPDDQY